MSVTSVNIDGIRSAEDQIRQSEALRGAMYYVLGKALSSPLTMESDLPETLRDISAEAPRELHAAARRAADAWEEALSDHDALALAYAQHFLGPFEILSPPYASFYLEPDHRLMGDVSLGVAESYASAGLKPGAGPREAPDHIALEWEFMYFLTHKAISTGDDRWLAKREDFRLRHMCKWVPEFSSTMVNKGKHPFYGAIAQLMDRVLLIK